MVLDSLQKADVPPVVPVDVAFLIMQVAIIVVMARFATGF
jgi:hypothetical protein